MQLSPTKKFPLSASLDAAGRGEGVVNGELCCQDAEAQKAVGVERRDVERNELYLLTLPSCCGGLSARGQGWRMEMRRRPCAGPALNPPERRRQFGITSATALSLRLKWPVKSHDRLMSLPRWLPAVHLAESTAGPRDDGDGRSSEAREIITMLPGSAGTAPLRQIFTSWFRSLPSS